MSWLVGFKRPSSAVTEYVADAVFHNDRTITLYYTTSRRKACLFQDIEDLTAVFLSLPLCSTKMFVEAQEAYEGR